MLGAQGGSEIDATPAPGAGAGVRARGDLAPCPAPRTAAPTLLARRLQLENPGFVLATDESRHQIVDHVGR